MHICNRAHDCPITECGHKKPHEGKCGPAMVCYTSNLLSACVPVVDGVYKTSHRKFCPHCEGRGFHDAIKEHKVGG